MRALLIDVYKDVVKEVDINTYKDFYPLIGCEVFDIVDRGIGNSRFCVVCDDEGLYVTNPRASVLDQDGNRMIVGNVVITGPVDINGDQTSLTDKDIQLIKDHVTEIPDFSVFDTHIALIDVAY